MAENISDFSLDMVLKVNSDIGQISDSDKKKLKSVVAQIDASHSAIINGNHFFYLPKGMANGADSFIKPFEKPVLVNHDSYGDTIGRVRKAKYKDYGLLSGGLIDSNYPPDVLEQILDFVQGDIFNQKDYEGLGVLQVEAEIVDAEAIKKVLDQRFLTVSIAGDVKDVVCSGCGTVLKDQMDKMLRGEEGSKKKEKHVCSHMRGMGMEDGSPDIFYIGGDMSFDELSYVSEPADPNAITRFANSRNKSLQNSFTICDVKFDNTTKNSKTVYIRYTNTKDNKEDLPMKTKLKDFLANPEDALKAVKDALKELGLESKILDDERYKRLRKTSFLFADEKILPISDEAHVLAAYKILENIEDEEKEGSKLDSAMDILDEKFKRVFKMEDINTEDALKTLMKPEGEDKGETADTGEGENTESKVTDAVVLDIDKLADEISKKLSGLMAEDGKDAYTFLMDRNRILQEEIEELEKENEKVTDQLKKVVIDHILTLDKAEDSDKLDSRSVESLCDKLSDMKGKKIADSKEDGEGTKSVADSSVSKDEGGEEEENDEGTEGGEENTPQFMDRLIVTSEYKRILKSDGLKAARNYLDSLKKEKKVATDFKLNS